MQYRFDTQLTICKIPRLTRWYFFVIFLIITFLFSIPTVRAQTADIITRSNSGSYNNYPQTTSANSSNAFVPSDSHPTYMVYSPTSSKYTYTAPGFAVATNQAPALVQPSSIANQTTRSNNTSYMPTLNGVTGDYYTGLDVIESPLGLGTTDIRFIIARIIRVFIGLLGIIAVVLIMLGGFNWMIAGGDEEKVTQAKSIIFSSVIGLIIIFSANSIANYAINSLIGATTGVDQL